MSPEENNRRRLGRPSVSCSICRKRKLKCDRASPCGNCLRSRSKHPSQDCVYEEPDFLQSTSLEPPSKRRAISPSTRQTSPNQAPDIQAVLIPQLPTPASGLDPLTVPAKNSQSEGLAEGASGTPSSTHFHALASPPDSVEVTNLHSGGSTKARYVTDLSFFGETCQLVGGVSHKSRVFGQSSWLAVVLHFKDLVELTGPYLQDEYAKALLGLRKCKALARSIKAQWTPPWPTPPTNLLPPRELADELINAYLRTTETLYRVLHVPTFRREYESVWLQWPDVTASQAFLVLLKLVFAIGATTYDDTFTLRSSAVTWVYEAQTYLSDPQSKSRLGLQYLQTSILLLIAREATGIDSDSVWVSAGSLVRTAISMGLHKDPTSLLARPVPRIILEMRRRLWNTILEITLQSSLDSGKPTLISLSNFDTQCPGNFDDEQLAADTEASLPKQDDQFTSVSMPIALRRTLPVRLAIAQLLNEQARQVSYDETLRLDTELRKLYKEMVSRLQGSKADTGFDTARFDICALDVIIHRYIAALHAPYLVSRPENTASAYSRKAAVDSALRIHIHGSGTSWYSPQAPEKNPPWPLAVSGSTFSRYTRCSSGFSPRAVFQADLIMAVELKTQLREQVNLQFGPAILRPDLLALLEDSKQFSLRCIEAGETNIKGYMFRRLAISHIQGMQQGLGEEDLRALVTKAAEDTVEECIPLLESMLSRSDGQQDQLEQEKVDRASATPEAEIPADAPEYWEHLVSENMLSPAGNIPDILSWMVTDDFTDGIVL